LRVRNAFSDDRQTPTTEGMKTEPTCACGGSFPAEAAWCSRCFARRPVEPVAGPAHPLFTASTAGRAAFATASPLGGPAGRPARPGRFAKTDTSFGLTGRIICTILLLIPLAFFVYLATQLIGIGGIVVYGGIICPWALRDLWKHPGRG
jgi:hypothetical protein